METTGDLGLELDDVIHFMERFIIMFENAVI